MTLFFLLSSFLPSAAAAARNRESTASNELLLEFCSSGMLCLCGYFSSGCRWPPEGRSVGVCEGQILLTLWYQAVTGHLFVEGCVISGTGS